ncbi:MAG: sterol desaturase family protein [Litorimonas sp.]
MVDSSKSLGEKYYDYVESFFAFLVDPNDRLFIVYLLSSFLVAYILFRKSKSKEGLFRFIFPKSVWDHPSAWLDVRYFLFHGLIGHFIVHLLTAGAFVLGITYTMSLENFQNLGSAEDVNIAYRSVIAALGLILMAVFGDFLAFCVHYLQHKNPLLWQFHKVHHSSEVMHPLSNFREHPIDNLFYKSFVNFVSGLIWGVFLTIAGFVPDAITIFGIGVINLTFNLVGYQLRHSHMWLKWPGVWSKVFPSPAHHHVHHSRHPDHLDKNFAFMFPVWDVLFKTYVMPEDNRDVEFGIVEDSSELNSCINLYVVPFRDAYRVIKSGKKTEQVGPLKADPLA